MKLRKALVASAVLTAITTISNPINAQIRVCQPCPAGQWSAGGTADACTPCPAGFYCANGNKTQCTAGQQCPAGSSSPSSCPAGQWSAGETTTACTQCTAGFFCQNGNRTQCTAGQHCPAGSSNPQSCPAGHRCPNGVAQVCLAGQFQNLPGQVVCNSCAAGTFQPLTGQASCNSCGDGWNGGPTAATALTQCVFNFSGKTVRQAHTMLRADGTGAWNTGTHHSNIRSACIGSSGLSLPSTASSDDRAGNCYCSARAPNGVWSSWGFSGELGGCSGDECYSSSGYISTPCKDNCHWNCTNIRNNSLPAWSNNAGW